EERANQLRPWWAWDTRPPMHGTFPALGWLPDRAGRLSRQYAIVGRPCGGPDEVRLRRRRRRYSAHSRGTIERSRYILPRTIAARTGCADHCRAWLSGIRVQCV